MTAAGVVEDDLPFSFQVETPEMPGVRGSFGGVLRPEMTTRIDVPQPTVVGTNTPDGFYGQKSCEWPWDLHVKGGDTGKLVRAVSTFVSNGHTWEGHVEDFEDNQHVFAEGVHEFLAHWHIGWTQDGIPTYHPFTVSTVFYYRDSVTGEVKVAGSYDLTCQ